MSRVSAALFLRNLFSPIPPSRQLKGLIFWGTEEQINFPQQSPKMLKMASESFIHALLLFLGLFLKISRWVPEAI